MPLSNAGQVLPIAWNRPEQVKMTPGVEAFAFTFG
jgi:hypothetical protein